MLSSENIRCFGGCSLLFGLRTENQGRKLEASCAGGELSVHNISFRYDGSDKDVFEGYSALICIPEERIALVGSNSEQDYACKASAEALRSDCRQDNDGQAGYQKNIPSCHTETVSVPFFRILKCFRLVSEKMFCCVPKGRATGSL